VVDIAAIVSQRKELLCAGEVELEGANAAFFRDGHLGSILALGGFAN
jgi:hypothetical protein